MRTESFVIVTNRRPFILGCHRSPPECARTVLQGAHYRMDCRRHALKRRDSRPLRCYSRVSVRLDCSAECGLLAARSRDYRKRIRRLHRSRQSIGPPCIRRWPFALRLEDPRQSEGVRARVRCAMHRRLRASEVCDSYRSVRTVSGGASCATVAVGLLGRPSSTPQCSNLSGKRIPPLRMITCPRVSRAPRA
jgi:hypothetical protein